MQVMKSELAWAAGFFEGEVCVRLAPSGKPRKDGSQYKTIRISISNTEKPLMDRFSAAVQHGGVRKRGPSGLGKKDLFIWDASGKPADTVMETLLPFMIGNKAQLYKDIKDDSSN